MLVFASLFDPVLEMIEILGWSHFDLKLFVKSLEVAIMKELLKLMVNVYENLQNLLHRLFKAFDVAVVQPVERLSFFIKVDEVETVHHT